MEAILTALAEHLKEKLRNELISQDHIAKGNLLNSIDVYVEKEVERWTVKGGMLDYGITQDTGAPPGTYVSVAVLLEWIRDKKLNVKDRVGFAIATSRKIYEVGTPTNGDPKKKRWISGTLENEAVEIERYVREAAYEEFEIIVNNMIEKTQKELTNGKN